MASRGPGPGQPEVGFLYKTTNEALEIFGKLSLTSQFKVSLHLTNGGDDLMNWLAAAGMENFQNLTFIVRRPHFLAQPLMSRKRLGHVKE